MFKEPCGLCVVLLWSDVAGSAVDSTAPAISKSTAAARISYRRLTATSRSFVLSSRCVERLSTIVHIGEEMRGDEHEQSGTPRNRPHELDAELLIVSLSLLPQLATTIRFYDEELALTQSNYCSISIAAPVFDRNSRK